MINDEICRGSEPKNTKGDSRRISWLYQCLAPKEYRETNPLELRLLCVRTPDGPTIGYFE
jgi:hypothetical protein